jgi:hypothetical protein
LDSLSGNTNQRTMDIGNVFSLDQLSSVDLAGLSVRFAFNLVIASLLILLVYRRYSKNKEFCFTLFSFNLIIFALCTILNNVNLSIGSGFGLFAVFTMMRYRSEQLQIKDMTYLLILIGLGFVNATFSEIIGITEIAFLNISIILSLFVLEKTLFNHDLVKQKIKYNDLELLRIENRPLLKTDLEYKIGAQIENIHVESINFMEGTANIAVKYNAKKPLFSGTNMKRQDNGSSMVTTQKDPVLMKGI